MSESTSIPFSEDTRLRMPIKMIAALCAVVAAGAIAWGLTSSRVEEHDKRLNSLETEQRSARDLLIRIDENVKALKEARR